MHAKPDPAEERTQEIGRELLARIEAMRPGALSAAGFEERAMDLLVRDPALRVKLLRFIDVFPVLRTSEEVRAHLGAYLTESDEGAAVATLASRLVRWGGWLAAHDMTPSGLTAALSRWATEHMAQRFIVETDAVASLRSLEEEGFLFTLDVLGESVHSRVEADAFQRRYRELAEGLAAKLGDDHSRTLARPHARTLSGPRVNLSVKLSALCPHFDPIAPEHTGREVLGRLRPILRAARAAGSFIQVDMEHFEVRDLTWHILRSVLDEEEFRDWEDVGIVVQAYLCDAESHLREILDWLHRRGRRLTVRLVKGAYWDSEQIWALQRGWPIPVFTHKPETDAQCERMLRTLLEHRDLVRTALGSHNVRTVARGLALHEALSTLDSRPSTLDFEVQVLHGMGNTLRRALVSMGVPVRVYVPWGQLVPGMSYLVRRLLENTSNESFLRQMSGHALAPEELLCDPATLLGEKDSAT